MFSRQPNPKPETLRELIARVEALLAGNERTPEQKVDLRSLLAKLHSALAEAE
jgi:hypothetical protein